MATIALLLVAGCQLNTGTLVRCPWQYSRQQQAVLELVPLGTPRDAAIERLAAEGIAGAFGINDTIYYCDVWQREDGDRWHLNVAVLFDESGLVKECRPAQAAIVEDRSAD